MAKKMEPEDNAGVRFPPPLVYLGFLLIGLAIGALIGRPGFGLRPYSMAIGAAPVAIGCAIIAYSLASFLRANTRPEPWEPTTSIVETGLYRVTRNPMYLAMALIHAGLALMLDSIVGLLMLPIAMFIIETQVIAREERYLEAKFGEDYRRYKARVRRWL